MDTVLISGKARHHSSVVPPLAVVLACYGASDEQTLVYSHGETFPVTCLTASEKEKDVAPAREGTCSFKSVDFKPRCKRFNYIRTSRTNMKQKSGKCVAFYAFNSTGKITPVSCGKWSCEVCAKDNARLWAWRARLQLDNDDRQYYFWTFTLGSKYKNAKQGFSALPLLWNRLRMAIVRHYRKATANKAWKWTYLAFVEGQTKRGNMPHFHVLSASPAPYRIKDFAVHTGFGYQATQEKIEGKRAANYVTKYASKGNPDMPKGFRRCRPSQDWNKLPPYAGNKLFVKAKNESNTDFIIRVHEATGAELDDLWEQWQYAHEMD